MDQYVVRVLRVGCVNPPGGRIYGPFATDREALSFADFISRLGNYRATVDRIFPHHMFDSTHSLASEWYSAPSVRRSPQANEKWASEAEDCDNCGRAIAPTLRRIKLCPNCRAEIARAESEVRP